MNSSNKLLWNIGLAAVLVLIGFGVWIATLTSNLAVASADAVAAREARDEALAVANDMQAQRDTAIASLEQVDQDLEVLQGKLDGLSEASYYDGLATGCLVIWGGNLQKPKAQVFPWCARWWGEAKEFDAYHKSIILQEFLKYLEDAQVPPTPKNQARPIIKGSLINVGFEHGTRVLGH